MRIEKSIAARQRKLKNRKEERYKIGDEEFPEFQLQEARPTGLRRFFILQLLNSGNS
jgi:hypothetical protein